MAHECGFTFTAMKEHYFDDLKVGDRFKSEPLNVTEKQLIEFAHKFDPQMFHLSNVVRPGDVLTVETKIVHLRPSRSRPRFGIIRLRNVTTNQRGEIVQTMLGSAMVPKRDPKETK